MLQFLILLLIIVALLIIVGIPVLAFRFHNKLKIKGHKKAANFVALAFIFIAVFIGYETIEAIYPGDDFYKENFKSDLEVDFPKTGKITYKDAGYPDIHGHYISACSFEVDPESFKQLLKIFPANSNYCNCGSVEIDHVMQHYNKKDINRIHKKGDGYSSNYLLFLNDNKTVIYLVFHGIDNGCP